MISTCMNNLSARICHFTLHVAFSSYLTNFESILFPESLILIIAELEHCVGNGKDKEWARNFPSWADGQFLNPPPSFFFFFCCCHGHRKGIKASKPSISWWWIKEIINLSYKKAGCVSAINVRGPFMRGISASWAEKADASACSPA